MVDFTEDALVTCSVGSRPSARRCSTQSRRQSAVKAWISEGLESGAEFRHEMESMVSFGDNLHQVANLESAVRAAARCISCFVDTSSGAAWPPP